MANELTTVRTTSAATNAQRAHFAIEGMEGLGQADVIIPRYTIVQPTSQGKGDVPGVFHSNLSDEGVATIKAVILRVTKSRTLWSGDLADKKPQCASYDGVTGRCGDDIVPCDGCEFNRWPMDKDDKTCKSGYLYLCVNVADDSRFLYGAMGTSVKPAKMLNSLFVNKRRSPFSAIVEFGTTKVEDPAKGKYWIFKPTIVEWLDAERTEYYRGSFLEMQGVNIKEVEDAAVDVTTEEEAPF